MVKKLGKSISLTLVLVTMAVWSLFFIYSCRSTSSQSSQMNSSEDTGSIDALGANAACYICHMGFVKEQISKTHLNKKITCIHCHGLSAAHANDENIGATPPDITFEHDQIDKMCMKCHTKHQISDEELAKYQSHPVCTDCHGSHKINRPAD